MKSASIWHDILQNNCSPTPYFSCPESNKAAQSMLLVVRQRSVGSSITEVAYEFLPNL
jgi:hypothetical protein